MNKINELIAEQMKTNDDPQLKEALDSGQNHDLVMYFDEESFKVVIDFTNPIPSDPAFEFDPKSVPIFAEYLDIDLNYPEGIPGHQIYELYSTYYDEHRTVCFLKGYVKDLDLTHIFKLFRMNNESNDLHNFRVFLQKTYGLITVDVSKHLLPEHNYDS